MSDQGATKADYRRSKAHARENDAADREYYEAQMRSEGIDPATGLPVGGGSSSVGSSSKSPRERILVVHQKIKSGAGSTVAGAALGALAFFTLRAYVQGRWSGANGVRAFYAAKFVNRTSSSPNPVPSSSSTGTTSSSPPTKYVPGSGGLVPTTNPKTGQPQSGNGTPIYGYGNA